MTLQEGVERYIVGLEGPANAWGAYHVEHTDGDMILSHAYLWWLYRKFGQAEVEAELEKKFKGNTQ